MSLVPGVMPVPTVLTSGNRFQQKIKIQGQSQNPDWPRVVPAFIPRLLCPGIRKSAF